MNTDLLVEAAVAHHCHNRILSDRQLFADDLGHTSGDQGSLGVMQHMSHCVHPRGVVRRVYADGLLAHLSEELQQENV